MKLRPQHRELSDYVDHYWIVQNPTSLFSGQQQLFAFPGLTPEMIIILEGQLNYRYLGKYYCTNQSTLFAFLHGDIYLNFSQLIKFVVVVFKPRALASVQPFLKVVSQEFIKQPIQPLSTLFSNFTNAFKNKLNISDPITVAHLLDEWLVGRFNIQRKGFVTELTSSMSPDFSLQTLREKTNYSVSTLERYFKQDAGLSPKRYQKLYRFRAAIENLYETKSADWSQYVYDFGYFDQSHFIKEIKAYTGFTPTQLLKTPGILPFRPK